MLLTVDPPTYRTDQLTQLFLPNPLIPRFPLHHLLINASGAALLHLPRVGRRLPNLMPVASGATHHLEPPARWRRPRPTSCTWPAPPSASFQPPACHRRTPVTPPNLLPSCLDKLNINGELTSGRKTTIHRRHRPLEELAGESGTAMLGQRMPRCQGYNGALHKYAISPARPPPPLPSSISPNAVL